MRPQPGQWGEHGTGWLQKHGFCAHTGKVCWGLGLQVLLRAEVHIDQQSLLLQRPAFLGEVVGMVGLEWREEP